MKSNKQNLAESIVFTLRISLLYIWQGATKLRLHCVLLRLRLTENPAALQDPVYLHMYLSNLLGFVFDAFTKDSDLEPVV